MAANVLTTTDNVIELQSLHVTCYAMAFWDIACHKIQLVCHLGHSHHGQQTTQYN